MPMSNAYCVYILANRSRNLYVGVTNNLDRRLHEYRHGAVPGFTSRYRISRLVHYETFGDVRDAIAREKEIKGWRREKKLRLIQYRNPFWQDLNQPKQQIPHRRSPTTGDRVRNDNVQP